MRFLDHGASLFFFFADVQQADTGVPPLEHIAGVHRAEVSEVDELARVAIDVRAAVDDQDRVSGGWKHRADRGAVSRRDEAGV